MKFNFLYFEVNFNEFDVLDALNFSHENDFSTILPRSIRKESVFMYDLENYDFGDILSDGNGSYREYGNKTKYYEKHRLKDGSLKFQRSTEKVTKI